MDNELEKIFFHIHSDIPRQGPGDFESTKRAFSVMNNLPERPLLLDIGCGPGKQTLDLADITDGTITAVDNCELYIEQLHNEVIKRGLNHRIKAVNGDMFTLDFPHNSFDIIWSEGAIYIIGFNLGLRTWQPFLKKNGFIAVTELTWLKDNLPEEVRAFWHEAYPGMKKRETNCDIIKNTGYSLIDNFTLSEEAWWNDYYMPLEKRLHVLKNKYQNNMNARHLIEAEENEIELFRKYSDCYGYVFYIMRYE